MVGKEVKSQPASLSSCRYLARITLGLRLSLQQHSRNTNIFFRRSYEKSQKRIRISRGFFLFLLAKFKIDAIVIYLESN